MASKTLTKFADQLIENVGPRSARAIVGNVLINLPTRGSFGYVLTRLFLEVRSRA